MLKTIIEYIILFIIVYILISLVPSINKSIKDIIIITTFIIMICIIFNLTKKIMITKPEKMENVNQESVNTVQSTVNPVIVPVQTVNPVTTSVQQTVNPTVNPTSQPVQPAVLPIGNSEMTSKPTEKAFDKPIENTKDTDSTSFNKEENVLYKSNDDIMTDETVYDTYGNFISAHQLYVPPDYKTNEEDYGYTFVRSEDWFRTNPKNSPVPVCVPAGGRCKVCSSQTTGYPVDLKLWHRSRRISNPDSINTDYIKDKLNAGR
jgi:hypothetical protein